MSILHVLIFALAGAITISFYISISGRRVPVHDLVFFYFRTVACVYNMEKLYIMGLGMYSIDKKVNTRKQKNLLLYLM